MSEENIKKSVREFYNQVGWQTIGDMLYQNAQYEDLRPVSQEYLHRCHMRVKRHLAPEGTYYLDAGSGPVQYPEYLTYSEGYQARVCMDISIVALKEARKRVGEHGLYVVADITKLPFKSDLFDGTTALHTIHHVPMDEKRLAYDELHRTLKPGRQMVVVDGWTHSPMTNRLLGWMALMRRLRALIKDKNQTDEEGSSEQQGEPAPSPQGEASSPTGTFVDKFTADGLIDLLSGAMDFDILVWRSVSVSFLRSVIYPDWGGRTWLKLLFWLEERFPKLLGRIGQYPLIVIRKPAGADEVTETPSEV
jgi:SAM-dependent methyltransferase